MSRLENASKQTIASLVTGQSVLLDQPALFALAAILALVSIRIEFTAEGMRTLGENEIDQIRNNFFPTDNWKIWIAKHAGRDLKDYRYGYTAMQVADLNTAVLRGREYCNTQVTTLVVGQLYAHIFYSSVWSDFRGYEGAPLAQIWPHPSLYVDSRSLPTISDEMGDKIREALPRLGKDGEVRSEAGYVVI